MPIAIRPAAESDLPALAALESACFAHPWSEKSLAETLGNGRSLFLLAEREGEAADCRAQAEAILSGQSELLAQSGQLSETITAARTAGLNTVPGMRMLVAQMDVIFKFLFNQTVTGADKQACIEELCNYLGVPSNF